VVPDEGTRGTVGRATVTRRQSLGVGRVAPVPWQPLPGDDDRDPERVASALDRVVRHLGAPSAGALDELFRRWPEAAGPELAAHTRPLGVRDGVVVVAVDDPAWSTAVRFAEAGLLSRLATVLGGQAVTRVEVRVRPEAR
jgi:predicted nucleic acid-binding Zn ribbon protein